MRYTFLLSTFILLLAGCATTHTKSKDGLWLHSQNKNKVYKTWKVKTTNKTNKYISPAKEKILKARSIACNKENNEYLKHILDEHLTRVFGRQTIDFDTFLSIFKKKTEECDGPPIEYEITRTSLHLLE